ncbi:MAG TPA: FecR domain-containing protein [Reyranella sp.]|nr:FecR domain-containing protein [Reyranella sp.]
MTRSFVRTALLLAVPFMLGNASAFARVGVTSATDGDPLGKPPAGNERVLRIGLDIQADEVVTTTNNDRAHLVFLDGTSLTVGPNARVVIDKFVYDPNTKTGELALTAGKGVFRLVGGKISKTNAINVTTPSGTIGIRGGISIFSVTAFQTISNFIFGTSMTVTGSGQTQIATRPGSQVIVNAGAPPSLPSLLPPGGLVNDMNQLETGKSDSSGSNQGVSVLANSNSGQPFNVPSSTPNPGTTQQQTTNAINSANTQTQQNDIPTSNTPTSNTTTPSPKTTQTLNGYVGGLIVNRRGEVSTTRSTEALLSKPTDLVISTDAQSGQVKGKIVFRTVEGIVPVTTTLQMGTTANNGNNFFTDDSHYAMTTSDDPERTSKVQVLGHTYNIQDNSALVSNAVNQASSEPVLVRGTPGACTCTYLTWGWWQTSITYTSGYRAGQTDTVSQAPYIAGTLATSVQLPQTGSATYSGFMVGNVQNGRDLYNAAGSYNSTWSFQNRAGSFNASFDNRSYTGAILATPGTGGVSFAGGMLGTGGLVGTLSGSFFSGGGDAAKYQAGAFAIGQNSSIYKASGIFAGQR